MKLVALAWLGQRGCAASKRDLDWVTEGTERASRGTEVWEGRPAVCLVSVFLWLHFLILKSVWWIAWACALSWWPLCPLCRAKRALCSLCPDLKLINTVFGVIFCWFTSWAFFQSTDQTYEKWEVWAVRGLVMVGCCWWLWVEKMGMGNAKIRAHFGSNQFP